jgi:hypothetical protein
MGLPSLHLHLGGMEVEPGREVNDGGGGTIEAIAQDRGMEPLGMGGMDPKLVGAPRDRAKLHPHGG